MITPQIIVFMVIAAPLMGAVMTVILMITCHKLWREREQHEMEVGAWRDVCKKLSDEAKELNK